MTRERWGTFSVKDHTRQYPFATDVLIFDRLVIPRPEGAAERARWHDEKGWDPDRLDSALEILGLDEHKGHAVQVKWNQYTIDLFDKRAETAKIVGAEANYELTRRLLANELLPDAPEGIARVAVLSSYPSLTAVEEEWIDNSKQEKAEILTMALAHEFAAPDPKGKSWKELLQESVDLAKEPQFKKKRSQMYRWQDDVIEKRLSLKDALEEMAQYVEEYNAAIKKAVGRVYQNFAFTLIPIGLTLSGGPLGLAAGLGSIANLVRFWVYDRKPVVECSKNQAAAMFHTVQKELGWRQARS